MKLLFVTVFFYSSLSVTAQDSTKFVVADTTFPENWDPKQKLRENVYDVLAWVHKKNQFKVEFKSCLVIFESTDSLGKPILYLSEYVSNKSPFTKWNRGYIHFSKGGYFTTSGIEVGYLDTHLEIFDHKPLQEEVYKLIKRWEFRFYEDDFITLEAGFNSKLWQRFFDFKPDLNFFIK